MASGRRVWHKRFMETSSRRRLAGSSRSQSRHQIRPSPLSRINRPAAKWARGRVLESPPAARRPPPQWPPETARGRDGLRKTSRARTRLSHKGGPGPRHSSPFLAIPRAADHMPRPCLRILASLCVHMYRKESALVASAPGPASDGICIQGMRREGVCAAKPLAISSKMPRTGH